MFVKVCNGSFYPCLFTCIIKVLSSSHHSWTLLLILGPSIYPSIATAKYTFLLVLCHSLPLTIAKYTLLLVSGPYLAPTMATHTMLLVLGPFHNSKVYLVTGLRTISSSHHGKVGDNLLGILSFTSSRLPAVYRINTKCWLLQY